MLLIESMMIFRMRLFSSLSDVNWAIKWPKSMASWKINTRFWCPSKSKNLTEKQDEKLLKCYKAWQTIDSSLKNDMRNGEKKVSDCRKIFGRFFEISTLFSLIKIILKGQILSLKQRNRNYDIQATRCKWPRRDIAIFVNFMTFWKWPTKIVAELMGNPDS